METNIKINKDDDNHMLNNDNNNKFGYSENELNKIWKEKNYHALRM
mgnify:CR=1 FL=1